MATLSAGTENLGNKRELMNPELLVSLRSVRYRATGNAQEKVYHGALETRTLPEKKTKFSRTENKFRELPVQTSCPRKDWGGMGKGWVIGRSSGIHRSRSNRGQRDSERR